MKTTKTTPKTKSTKKTNKKLPVIGTIDLKDVCSYDDVLVETIYAKIRTAVTEKEYEYFINKLVDEVSACFDLQNEAVHWAIDEIKNVFVPKKPWYKRLWNKIFGK